MKNKILLTLALGLAGVSSLKADVDVYITGSTAFRANVFTACTKLYSGTPNVYFGPSALGGDANNNASTAAWCMSGTPITGLTNLNGTGNLIIHGLFSGSIQGIQTVEQSVSLGFVQPIGTFLGLTNASFGVYNAYTNTAVAVNKKPTIGFSDSSADSTTYPTTINPNIAEENVCVVPFGFFTSKIQGTVGNNALLTNINNVTWEQAYYGIPKGYIPLSSWTMNPAHTNVNVYLAQRTVDSGTRRTETACFTYQQGDPVGVYIYDQTNNNFYLPTNPAIVFANGGIPGGVIGSKGLNGVNTNYGCGYVGGGQVAAALNAGLTGSGSGNSQIAFLALSDAKSVGQSNWCTAVSYNGIWPTAQGPLIRGNKLPAGTTPGTNDYTPITSGYYPLWGNEVLVHLVDPQAADYNGAPTDQTITKTQLGSNTKPGSFLGVFNAQTLIFTNLAGIPLQGSIENEIELSKTNLATAIRLSEMKSNRSAVGGVISPF